MSKFALIASIDVAPGRRNEFLPLLRRRGRCLKDEPGTLPLRVLLPHDGGDKVMLYELYQDQAAFDAHSNGPSLAQLRKEAAGMMGKSRGRGARFPSERQLAVMTCAWIIPSTAPVPKRAPIRRRPPRSPRRAGRHPAPRSRCAAGSLAEGDRGVAG